MSVEIKEHFEFILTKLATTLKVYAGAIISNRHLRTFNFHFKIQIR